MYRASTGKKRIQRRRRSVLFLVFSTLIVLVAGILTLLWQQQQRQISRADDPNIVGPPTLTAATVDQIFARVGSPMVGTGQAVEDAARKANIDDAFALAVWWTETNDGAAGVGLGDRNPGSVRGNGGNPVAYDGYTIYPTYADAVTDWFDLLSQRYVNRGLTSVYTICYPYVGTSGAASWANKVMNLMARYHAEAPPPTPTPKPPINPHLIDILTPLPTLASRAMLQESRPQAVLQTDNTAAQNTLINASQPQTHVLSVLSEEIIISVALLAAGLLALLGLKLRRTLPETEPDGVPLPNTTALALETTNLSALYMNEFSPVVQHPFAEPLPVAFSVWSHETSQTAPIPVPESTGNVHIVQHAKDAKASRPRRVLLQSEAGRTKQISQLRTERPVAVWNSTHEPSTQALPPYHTSVSLPDMRREAVVAGRSGGLLQRYGDNAEKKQD